MVAVSFVQTEADLRQARQLDGRRRRRGRPAGRQARAARGAQTPRTRFWTSCDAVMVARGDLGLEMPLEQVPRAQKTITRRARQHGIPVIVATQVLESMTEEPRPTRAEVNDAASAVADGVDAIMLAGETAVGRFPARAVQTLDAIIRDAELTPSFTRRTARRRDARGRSCAGALRGGRDARQSRRRAGDCRRHAWRRHRPAAVGVASAGADFRHDRSRRDGAAARVVLGRHAGLHRHRRERRCRGHADRPASS